MRNTVPCLILATILSGNIYAQEAEPAVIPASDGSKNIFYFHPVDLLWNTFKISYERDFGMQSNSFMMAVGLLLKDGSGGEVEEKGIGGEIHLRVTIYKIEPSQNFRLKLYAAPFLKARYIDRGYTEEDCTLYDTYGNCIEYEETGHTSYVRSYGGGLAAGLRMTLIQKIVIGLYIGGQARYVDYTPFNKEPPFNDNFNVIGITPLALLRNIDNDATKSGIYPLAGFQLGFAF